MLDNAKITPKQFAFGVACIIQSSALLTALFIDISNQDSWIVILTGMLTSIPLIIMYGWIMKTFPQKNLFQVMELLFGKVGGKIISIFYIYFFSQLTCLNLHDIGAFMIGAIMPKTPMPVILITIMFACAYAVRGDVGVIMKFAPAFTVITLVVFLTALVFTYDIIDLDNFLPMFDQPPLSYLQGTHVITTVPFAEVVMFLMITPNISLKREKFKKYFLFGFIMGALTLLLVVVSSIATLGSSLSLFTLPPFEMLTIVDITSALSRMEILSAIAILMLLFFKISLLYYISVVSIAYLFNLEKYVALSYAFGAICVVYSTFIYNSMMQHVFIAVNVTVFIWLFFELIFPAAIVITTLIRKKEKKIIDAMNEPPPTTCGSLNNMSKKPLDARPSQKEMEKTGA